MVEVSALFAISRDCGCTFFSGTPPFYAFPRELFFYLSNKIRLEYKVLFPVFCFLKDVLVYLNISHI